MVTMKLDYEFIQELIRQVRAQDTYGVMAKRSDEQLIEPFIIDKEQRKEIPIIGDPDKKTLRRIELFYGAASLLIERRYGQMVTPFSQISHEGFGRVVLLSGRLVIYNRQLRDVHRFGFLNVEEMVAKGEEVVLEASMLLDRFPEVANF